MTKDDLMRFTATGCVITEAQWIYEGTYTPPTGDPITGLPPFVRVAVTLKPTVASDIKMELWMPIAGWNGRFLGTGNGGGGGNLYFGSCVEGLRCGFATANTDLGTSPGADSESVVNIPEKHADFGHRATHEMTVNAKKIIEAFYGRPVKAAYFQGGSTGGSQAIMEAQRYPQDYNGIISLVPANNRTLLHTYFLWNYRAFHDESGAGLSEAEVELVHEAFIAARDTSADGGAPWDRFFNDPRHTFARTDAVIDALPLNPAQKRALCKVYSGPVNPRTGERIFGPLPAGGEKPPYSLHYYQSRDAAPKGLFYVFRWAFGADFDPFAFDFDRDLETLQERLAPLLNANDPDLSGFNGAGGKLLVAAGTHDPVCPYHDTLNYYDRICAAQGGAGDFVRLFLLAGQGHGELGRFTGSNGEPLLDVLIAWVERGVKPDALLFSAAGEGDTNTMPICRPVYPYPQFAVCTAGEHPAQPADYKAVERARGGVPAASERLLRW